MGLMKKMTKDKFDLTGKVAILTGATKGIGEGMARGLAEYGATVVISSRKQEAVDKVAAEYNAAGLSAMGMVCHVGKADHRENLVKAVMEKYGRIDCLINNAAINPYYGPLHKLPQAALLKTMDVNVNAILALSNEVFPIMKKQGGGSIINISSTSGLHADENNAAYNISKAALIMLGQNQAQEWGKYNIRVNTVCPGFVKTKLSEVLLSDEANAKKIKQAAALKRYGTADEFAGLAVFLASDASSFMTGATLLNDGGLLLAPIIS